jgi:hypothetical protein
MTRINEIQIEEEAWAKGFIVGAITGLLLSALTVGLIYFIVT